MKRILIPGLIVVMCVMYTGCRADTDERGPAADGETAYVAEELPMLHQHIFDAITFENTLYYQEIFNFQQVSERELILFRLDLTQASARPKELPYRTPENGIINKMTVDQSGKLNLLVLQYDGNAAVTDALWVRLDEEGRQTSICSVNELLQGVEIPYFSGFEIDHEGNAYFLMHDILYVVDDDGKLVFQTGGGEHLTAICKDQHGGRIYVAGSGSQGEMRLAPVDVKTKTLGTWKPLTWLSSMVSGGPGTEKDLTLFSETGIFEYDAANETYTEKCKWAALDLPVNDLGIMMPLSDGRFLYLDRAYTETDMKSTLTVIRPGQDEDPDQADKTVLTLGGLSPDISPDIREAAAAFNRSHPDYRIALTEYDDDEETAAMQLYADIASGDSPDILILPHSPSISLNTQQTMLEDLYPYIDRDTSMNREDFLINVLDACSKEGKLYGIPLSFSIRTIAGRTSLLSGRESWTLDEMIAMAGQSDSNSFFLDASKSAVLRQCLLGSGDRILSFAEEENPFDRDLFLKMLDFANRFINDGQTEMTDEEDMLSKMEEDQIISADAHIYDFYSSQLYRTLFGEPVSYIGYPSEDGAGSLISSYTTIALSKQCVEKEAAWQFIGTMLTEEFQAGMTIGSGFPIHRGALDRMAGHAMEQVYTTDENGNQQETTKGGLSMGSFYMEFYAASEEDVLAIKNLIGMTNKTTDMDEQISQIILEESQAFFTGSKTASQVADIVENRLRLYMSES